MPIYIFSKKNIYKEPKYQFIDNIIAMYMGFNENNCVDHYFVKRLFYFH